jgi:hypothetical protein
VPDDLAAELRALAAHLEVGEPADQREAVRARLTEPGLAPWWKGRRVRLTEPGPALWWKGRRARLAEPGPAPWRKGRRARLAEPGPAPWWKARRVRRWILAGVAALVVAVAGVAPARAAVAGAVGGLLRLAGIEVQREPAPGGLPARPSPLPSVRAATLDEARRTALFPVRVPAALGAPEEVRLADPDPAGAPRVVTLLYRGGTVRLDEFDGTLSPSFFKTAPEARWADLGTADGVWLPAPHPVTYVGRDGVQRTGTARLAGPTLIWTDGRAAYRLEGVGTLAEARAIALSP